MNEIIFYCGIVVEFKRLIDNPNNERYQYILAQLHKDGYVFQVVCISGKFAGYLEGYIKEDPLLKDTHKAITKEHLLKELEWIFGPIDFETLLITKPE